MFSFNKPMKQKFTLAAGSVSLLLILSACAGLGSTSGNQASTQTDTGLNETDTSGINLDELLVEDGKLIGATTCTAPPYNVCAPGTTEATGLWTDVGELYANELGLELVAEGMDTPAMLPAVQSGQADILLALGDTAERRELFDFVLLLKSGAAIVTQTDNEDIQQVTDLCGERIASPQGSNLEEQVVAVSEEKCEAQGLPPFEINVQQNSDAVKLAIRAGRDAAGVTTGAEGALLEQEEKETFRVVEMVPSEDVIFGVGIPKDNPELRDKIYEALQRSVDNGEFQKVLEKWNVTEFEIDEISISK